MSDLVRSSAGEVTGFKHAMITATTEELAGYKVVANLGVVRGNTMRARHVGRDIVAAFRTLVGGEIHEYTKLMGESREQAMDRMLDQAKSVGANAVLGVRFTTSTVMQGAAELLAYGTAVKVEKIDS